MLLFWEWKFKIKKIDYGDHDSLKKLYKSGLPKLKPAPNFLKILAAWSGNQAYRIPEDVKKRVYGEIENMKKELDIDFNEHTIQKRGCFAAGKICSFINNILQFNKIYLFVKPLQEEMEASTKLANEKQAELKEI